MDILLVDDSKVMRSLVQRAIRQAGYRGLLFGEAENGVQALEKLKENEPKLVLSDWNMPEMTGIELLQQVRANANKVPFGFITSESSAQIRELAVTSGASFVITKPFTSDDVQAALTPFWERHKTMAETTPFELNKMFSSLTGKQVTFTLSKTPPPDSKKHVYGTYDLLPDDSLRLVKADVALIGSFGGALMGLPKSAVTEGLKEVPLDETIHDAMHEILNVSATLVSIEKRAIFRKMFFNVKELPEAAAALLKKPKVTMHFQVSIAGYDGGAFSLMG